LYAIHSIEHVHDIEDFINQAKRILKINGYIFIEVPNARCEGDMININRNKIDIPHTYYFNIEYFEKVLCNIKLNKAFNQPFYSGDFEKWESFERTDGAVIIALGQIRA
jgi:ubiquinone/menaquinone biosynthesis C-methylase UbiE